MSAKTMRPPQQGQAFAGLGVSAAVSGSASMGSDDDVTWSIARALARLGGRDVEEEAADDLAGGQGHQLAPGRSVLAVVLPAEGHALVVHGDQAAVGYG